MRGNLELAAELIDQYAKDYPHGRRLDEISRAVSELRTPPSFADQLYVLRDHVAAVRRRLDVAIAS